MAKYSNMSLFEANSKAMENRFEMQKRQITESTYEWYRQIKVWQYPKNSYERVSWKSFIRGMEFRKYILGL